MQAVRAGGDSPEVLPGEHVPAGSASGWPLVIELPPLGALRTSPGAARAHVRVAVAAWRLEDDMADAAVVVTSELVTNAVQASTGPDGRPLYLDGHMAVVWVRLCSDGTRLIVEVWDQAPGYPRPRSARADNTDGRGLHLVETVTGRQWGWEPARGGPAVKCVWAVIRHAVAEMIAKTQKAGLLPRGVANSARQQSHASYNSRCRRRSRR